MAYTYTGFSGLPKNDSMADETLDFLTRDGGCVLAEYRVNKRERPSIRTTTTTRTKRKVTK